MYSPICNGVAPLLFMAFISAPLDNRISKTSLLPNEETLNEISLVI